MTSTHPELGWPHQSPQERQVLSLQPGQVATNIKWGPGRGRGIGDPPTHCALLACLDLPLPVNKVSLAPTSTRTIEGTQGPSGGPISASDPHVKAQVTPSLV